MSSPPSSSDNPFHQNHHQYPAASTTAIPTIQTLKNPKRSVSYNTQDPSSPISPDDIHNPHNQHPSPTNKKLDPAAATKMMKASLTGFLNSREAKAEVPKRKLQNMLMNTERNSRQARRASLSEGGGHGHGHRHSRSSGSGNGTRALLDPMESIRRSDEHYNGIR
ncbi:uncharacterized protein BDV14DRAFT_199548 [Aspergillus stella-maris]|uniref:uncharacterized protein n=1 Tax=Aspergillus stella-maris TaxID=1810926 RepID=UPI003CCDC94A